MQTKLYRLEHKETGKGPYMTVNSLFRLCPDVPEENIYFFQDLFRKYCFTSWHREVQDDVPGFVAGMFVACKSLEQLFQWFGDVNPLRYADFGILLYEITIDISKVKRGERQVAYSHEDVISKVEIPLTRELWCEHR